jgi:MFS family permease
VLEGWTGREIDLAGIAVHPITIALVAGIAVQGLAECFLSPRYLEFASRQAPKGEEGLYMGFSHLHTVIAWPLGFVLSGYLLDAWCPDPKTLPPDQLAAWEHATATGGELPAAYAHAHYVWYVFAAIGVISFLMLLVYQAIVRRLDRGAAAAPPSDPGPSAADRP